MKKILSIISVLVIIICIGAFTANAAETEKKEYSTALSSTTGVNNDNAERTIRADCTQNSECVSSTDCTRRAECRNYNECTSGGVCQTDCRENCTAEDKTTCPNAENRQRRNDGSGNGNCNGGGRNNANRGHCAVRGERSANCRNK